MPDLKVHETHKNLKNAFLDEAGTVHRYLYYAKIADIEGFPDAAQLFRDIAEGGACYAHGHLDFLNTVGDARNDLPVGETDRNLVAAISSEVRDCIELYPSLARKASAEGFPDIASWLENVARVKMAHVTQLRELLAQIQAGAQEVAK